MKTRYTFRFVLDVKELNEMWERDPMASTYFAMSRWARDGLGERLIYVIKIPGIPDLACAGCNAAPSYDATEMQVTTRGPNASQMADVGARDIA